MASNYQSSKRSPPSRDRTKISLEPKSVKYNKNYSHAVTKKDEFGRLVTTYTPPTVMLPGSHVQGPDLVQPIGKTNKVSQAKISVHSTQAQNQSGPRFSTTQLSITEIPRSILAPLGLSRKFNPDGSEDIDLDNDDIQNPIQGIPISENFAILAQEKLSVKHTVLDTIRTKLARMARFMLYIATLPNLMPTAIKFPFFYRPFTLGKELFDQLCSFDPSRYTFPLLAACDANRAMEIHLGRCGNTLFIFIRPDCFLWELDQPDIYITNIPSSHHQFNSAPIYPTDKFSNMCTNLKRVRNMHECTLHPPSTLSSTLNLSTLFSTTPVSTDPFVCYQPCYLTSREQSHYSEMGYYLNQEFVQLPILVMTDSGQLAEERQVQTDDNRHFCIVRDFSHRSRVQFSGLLMAELDLPQPGPVDLITEAEYIAYKTNRDIAIAQYDHCRKIDRLYGISNLVYRGRYHAVMRGKAYYYGSEHSDTEDSNDDHHNSDSDSSSDGSDQSNLL
jgi:hypothetical protein